MELEQGRERKAHAAVRCRRLVGRAHEIKGGFDCAE
jgi:hypothetical protein